MTSVRKWRLRAGFLTSLLLVMGGIGADRVWWPASVSDDEAARVVGGACPFITDVNCGVAGTNKCDGYQGLQESDTKTTAHATESTLTHSCGSTKCGQVARYATSCGSS